MNNILQPPHTFQTLVMILQDFEFQLRYPSWQIFNGAKVQRFKRMNAHHIAALDEKTAGLNALFVKKNEQGQPVVVIHSNGTGILDFHDDDAKRMYTEQFHSFLKKKINIIL